MQINAQDFGLVGRNKRKDTRAIQQALNVAKKYPHTTVFIPKGEYHIRKALVIYGNTTVIMDNQCVLKRCGRDALIKNGKKPRVYYGYNGNSHITIRGGVLDMNGIQYPYYNTALCIGHAREILIEEVTFKDVVGGHCIDACGLNGVHINKCNFLGFNDPKNKRQFSEAVQIDMQVKGAFPKFGATDGTTTQNMIIENCYFGPSDTPGMKAWNRAIGSHASRFDQYYTNIHIRRNTFNNMHYYALTPLKSYNIYIYDNLFQQCAGGIRYLGVKEGNIHAQDLQGRMRKTQAGHNLNIYRNRFEGLMAYDAVHIRSYDNIRHSNVVIANNNFTHDSQSLHFEDIEHLILTQYDKVKLKTINVIK